MGWDCITCTYRNEEDGDGLTQHCSLCKCKCKSKRPVTNDCNNNSSCSDVIEIPSDSNDNDVNDVNDVKPLQNKQNKPTKKVKTTSKQSTISFASTGTQQQQQDVLKGYCGAFTEQNLTKKELKTRAEYIMKNVFGIQKLRGLQPKSITAALKSKSQLIIMATGCGKSLCYQLPAIVLGGTTIVVSPLIALMHDQVRTLQRNGVEAAVIASSQTATHNKGVLERLLGRSMTNGTTKKLTKNQNDTKTVYKPVTLLYVTPEQIETPRFRTVLSELYETRRLTMFAIDEAHSISSWGHDFRKAYVRLAYIRTAYPSTPVLACTATATRVVMRDIQATLQLQDAPCYIGSFDRPNICYSVRYKDVLDSNSSSSSVGGAYDDLCRFIVQQHERTSKTNVAPCSGIVYVHKRDETSQLANMIRKGTLAARKKSCDEEIKVTSYHGGMKKDERTAVQEAWTSGKAQIVVATVSFGMGIDLAHVRYVVHWTMAKSLESFYQESGRAGRDGLPAQSVLYFAKKDASRFQYLLSMRKEPPRAGGDRDAEALDEMVAYCMEPGCRRYKLLKHFGETFDTVAGTSEKARARAMCNSSCDYCVNPDGVQQLMEGASCVNDFTQHHGKVVQNTSARTKGGKYQPKKKAHEYDDDASDTEGYGYGNATVGGLDVTGGNAPIEYGIDTTATTTSNAPSKMGGFQKASHILTKYEKREGGKKRSGTTSFKKRMLDQGDDDDDENDTYDNISSSKKQSSGNDRVRIPAHLQMRLPRIAPPAPKAKTSLDFAIDAARLRAELEASRADAAAKRKAWQPRSVSTSAAPPPPPTFSQRPTKRVKHK